MPFAPACRVSYLNCFWHVLSASYEKIPSLLFLNGLYDGWNWCRFRAFAKTEWYKSPPYKIYWSFIMNSVIFSAHQLGIIGLCCAVVVVVDVVFFLSLHSFDFYKLSSVPTLIPHWTLKILFKRSASASLMTFICMFNNYLSNKPCSDYFKMSPNNKNSAKCHNADFHS